MSSQSLRKRTGKRTQGSVAASSKNSEVDLDEKFLNSTIGTTKVAKDPQQNYWIALAVVTLCAIYTRFGKIGTPDQVVFDEVHFGKFASYYLERTYYFDLHPPFAKMLIALAGYFLGYDGHFKFTNIGDDYISNNVPYIGLRGLLALQGVITVPVMFMTLKTLGFSVGGCFLGSIFVCFDNAHISETRLILLDATLILSVALTMFTYAKFSTYRKQPFTKWWWTWLSLCGLALSCTISTKYVGVLTYVSIGIACAHELWLLLDYKKGLTVGEIFKHINARLWCLVIVPFFVYLFWFYLHFAILTKSGPGDSFMSAEFQETLAESPMVKLAKDVHYGDIVTIRHKQTDSLLRSHDAVYPLRYEDGRISSNSQQVTAIKFTDGASQDVMNQWMVLRDDPSNFATGPVHTNDVIRLQHVGTGGILWTHDVASPLKATHEEFTIALGPLIDEKHKETLFRLRYADSVSSNNNKNPKKLVKTKATSFRVLHVDTVVAMWTHDDELLPEWGFGHQEVCGNKKIPDGDNVWTFDEIVNLDPKDPRAIYVPKPVKTMPFLKKWWELQLLMFKHNNMLSSEHPYASQPESWPLALSGVSFFNNNEAKKQIFFTGNIIGFWIQVALLSIFVGIVLADQISRRRNVYVLTDRARSTLYNTLGFLFIAYCAHYFPFFLMNRQKFLHHYLPAHLIAGLFGGALVDFMCTNITNKSLPQTVNKPKLYIIVGGATSAIVWFFFYFSPLVYGDKSLSPAQVQSRQWLDIKLHFAK
ncbi:Dolichyl-phosphate-mannose--protein mannosyltransferase 4 [Scheffersomyces spartinae]|uniref:Dolichyl-phosphate-mannose--protein mannosyltransferase n=1 Tax=Scheffersomyces spartinae TaxID=45513 RepID=A0A9P7V8K0_9ASCO|nr:Dolichyl-phosphate-mannose--protein mannosyltransferase 4 [Scheffersomyces spartinae]KAG7192831.1 Dolichyl-phosphate-mannose--protein mannosyltransferase 4 [Scheffersomyces spartinae]